MLNSEPSEADIEENIEQRRAFIRRWAAFVREHDDEEWSRQQNRLIDSQLRRANELAKADDDRRDE